MHQIVQQPLEPQVVNALRRSCYLDDPMTDPAVRIVRCTFASMFLLFHFLAGLGTSPAESALSHFPFRSCGCPMTVEGTLKTAFPPESELPDPSRASTAVSGHFRLTGGIPRR